MKPLLYVLRLALTRGLSAIFSLVFAAASTSADTLVIPPGHESADAGGGSHTLTDSIRLQDCYGAALFPQRPILITELRFRPGASFGSAFSNTISNIRIDLSTTTNGPESLSATFALNVGNNNLTVFQGALPLRSSFTTVTNNAKDFDIVIPLQQPFRYDPSAGNLLVDFRNSSGGGGTFIDAPGNAGDLAGRAYGFPGTATTASQVDVGVDLLKIVYVDADCVSGMVAAWSFEGNALDSIGTNQFTLFGGPAYTAGKVGNALVYDAINDYTRAPASPALDIGSGTGLTIETWINPKSVASQQAIVEWNNAAGGIGAHLWISVTGPGNIRINLVDTNGVTHHLDSATGLIQTNRYQHLATTYDQTTGTLALYLDGTMIATTNRGAFRPQTTFSFYTGNRPSGIGSGSLFNGSLDELALYNRALSSNEVYRIFASGAAGRCSAQTIRANESFSLSANPNGAWQYGYQTNLGSDLVLLNSPRTNNSDNGFPIYSWTRSGDYPVIFHNPNSITVIDGGGQGVESPKALWLAPGQAPYNYAVIRYTVPLGGSGAYQIDTTTRPHFYGSLSGDAEFQVLLNGSNLVTQVLPTNAPPTTFSTSVTAFAGDTIDFAVGRGPTDSDFWSPLSLVASLTQFQHYGDVSITPLGRLFTNSVSVTLSYPDTNAVIRYTLDASVPTANSPIYTNSLSFNAAVTVSARAFLGTNVASAIASATFERVYVFGNDGIPASWRIQYFGTNYATNPNATANADPDGDGYTNLQEYLGGTSPLDNNSIPLELTVELIPRLNWNSVSNTTYNVQRNPNVNLNTWTNIATITATNSNATFIDFNPIPKAVYRIQRLP